MFKDFLDYPWDHSRYRYESHDVLLTQLEEAVIAPAISKVRKIEKRRKALEKEMTSQAQ